MRKFAMMLAALAAFSMPALAQAPPRYTTHAECVANSDWMWVGPKSAANSRGKWYNKCRRKPIRAVKDLGEKVKKSVNKN